MDKARPMNINTILNAVIIAAIGWAGVALQDGSKKLSSISERLVVIESTNVGKVEQLNRMEGEMAHLRQSLFELQLDVTKLKQNNHQ